MELHSSYLASHYEVVCRRDVSQQLHRVEIQDRKDASGRGNLEDKPKKGDNYALALFMSISLLT